MHKNQYCKQFFILRPPEMVFLIVRDLHDQKMKFDHQKFQTLIKELIIQFYFEELKNQNPPYRK